MTDTGYYDTSYPLKVLRGPAPVLASLNPTSVVANVGTPVTITGTGFLASARVYVDGVYYPSTVVLSGSSVRFTAMAPAAGSQTITVRNGATGDASNSRTLTVTATQDEPTGTPAAEPPPEPAPEPAPDPPPTEPAP